MITSEIDRLETEAEKAITKLAEQAIEHSKDAANWRNKAISNHKMRCAHMNSCSKYEMDFESFSINKKQLIVELKGRLEKVTHPDVYKYPEKLNQALMDSINTMKDCVNLIEKDNG